MDLIITILPVVLPISPRFFTIFYPDASLASFSQLMVEFFLTHVLTFSVTDEDVLSLQPMIPPN